MIGPSSSHTAGVARIGRISLHIFNQVPDKVEVTFINSFATTYLGHGSDKAVIAGILDFETDNPELKNSLEIANDKKLEYHFFTVPTDNTFHPNSLIIKLINNSKTTEIAGKSIGGGVVKIVNVDGFECSFTATSPTLIIKAKDVKGSISFLTDVISHDDCNIANMSVSRRSKNGEGCYFIELDSELRELTLSYLKSISWISELIYLNIKNL